MIIFKECNKPGYGYRTEMNILNSDLTIAIAKDFYSAGEIITKRICEKYGKLYLNLTFDEISNKEKIAEISQKISQQHDFSMPMVFKDGTNGIKMNKEYKGKSTIDLIIEKFRMGTTRTWFPNIKVGNILKFYSDDKQVFTRVVKAPYELKDIIPNIETYSGNIQRLNNNQIFVFGSNTKGIHGAGAAKKAIEFGAIYGNPKGRQGNTYAIITKDLDVGKRSIPILEIVDQIYWLYQYAKKNSELEFLIAYKNDNNNLNGYTSNEMAKAFVFAMIMNNEEIPTNIVFEDSFFNLMKAEYWSLIECWEYSRYFELNKQNKKQIKFTTNFNRRINIAGNGIYTLNKFNVTQTDCDNMIFNFLQSLNLPSGTTILSGGQTGVDESAIKAANNLNLNSKIYAPKSWKFRDINGKDVYGENLFKQRFLK